MVSARFGDIFRNNATKTGLVPVVVTPEFGAALMREVEDNPGTIVTIDIADRIISAPGVGLSESFPLDDFTRYRLLEGLDDIGLTLKHADKIASYEDHRPDWMPRVAQS